MHWPLPPRRASDEIPGILIRKGGSKLPQSKAHSAFFEPIKGGGLNRSSIDMVNGLGGGMSAIPQ